MTTTATRKQPHFVITVRVEAARRESIEKKLKLAFGDDANMATIEKVKTAESRADRLSEAEGMVDDARQIVEDLKDEMEQWRDSIPENLQGGDKYSQVDDACNALEEIQSNLEQSDWGVEFPGMF